MLLTAWLLRYNQVIPAFSAFFITTLLVVITGKTHTPIPHPRSFLSPDVLLFCFSIEQNHFQTHKNILLSHHLLHGFILIFTNAIKKLYCYTPKNSVTFSQLQKFVYIYLYVLHIPYICNVISMIPSVTYNICNILVLQSFQAFQEETEFLCY